MAGDLHALFVLIPQHTLGDAHSTLVYMGPPEKAAAAEILWNVGKSVAGSMSAPSAIVVRHDMLGPDKDTPVAILEGNDLYVARLMVDYLNNSEWGYLPHVTEQSDYPLPAVGTILRFDRLGLWYGEERFAWRFGSGASCAAR